MNESFDIWKLLAGLGIFLCGMYLLEDAVRILSGKTFRQIIRLYTKDRLRAIGSGTLVTAILQSSSAVSLMVLAFVGAGVMSMENAIGVILGANIGTTFTAWIVATLGFKIKIESFALPLISVGGLGLIVFRKDGKAFHCSRLLMGSGFLFLGLDYMKVSVENFANGFDLARTAASHGLWLYLLVGMVMTVMMQSSAATIAIVLTALHSSILSFEQGMTMVIGANVGTTIAVLLGSAGGIPSKKRVGFSHLIFNVVTAVVALSIMPVLVWLVSTCIDISTNSVMGLAMFHSLFNVLGVIIFFPFIGLLARVLTRIFPDHKAILTVYIDKTPPTETEAAIHALKLEIRHMLEECRLYSLRLMHIDSKLVFEQDQPFEQNHKRALTVEDLYEKIKLLHSEIFSFYSRVHNMQLDVHEVKELERVIYASRNIMNSIKNLKGIRSDLDEFDSSDNTYLNQRYKFFRRRLVEVYHDLNRIGETENQELQYRMLLQSLLRVENADRRFIRETMQAVSEFKVQEMEIASLLLVNRLFTQTCRLQIFGLKDTMLTLEQITDFDHTLDMKEIMDEEKARAAESRRSHVREEGNKVSEGGAKGELPSGSLPQAATAPEAGAPIEPETPPNAVEKTGAPGEAGEGVLG